MNGPIFFFVASYYMDFDRYKSCLSSEMHRQWMPSMEAVCSSEPPVQPASLTTEDGPAVPSAPVAGADFATTSRALSQGSMEAGVIPASLG
jgi:hypothetical protein